MVLFSDDVIHWIVSDKHPTSQGIASVNIKHAQFHAGSMTLTVYGLVSFYNCVFRKAFYMYLYKHKYEPKPTAETIQSFLFNMTQNRIIINRCQFVAFIHITEVVREIQIVQCDIGHLQMHIGKASSTQCNTFAFAHVVVDSSTVGSRSGVDIYAHSTTSFGLIQFSNTGFHKTQVQNHVKGGFIGFHFDNCTFSAIHFAGIIVHNALVINITNCEFRLKDHAVCEQGEGCAVNAKGQYSYPTNFELARSFFFPECTSVLWYECITVHIENSVFVGSAGTIGGAVSCEWINLIIINSAFTMTDKNKPAPTGGFIYYNDKYNTFTGINITLATSGTQFIMPVSIMAICAGRINFTYVHIMCQNSLSVVEEAQDIEWYVRHYKCEQHCKGDEYTFEAGSAILHGESNLYSNEGVNVASILIEPNCSSCPVGANCDEHIQVLPNYWGYKDQYDQVRMIRCPNGYCCQDDGTCKRIDACNEHRTGPLCGKCKSNWTESLFSPKCLLIDYCPAAEIVASYIACVMAYGLGLMAFNYVKDVVPNILKNMLKASKRKCACKKGKWRSPLETFELENLKTENSTSSTGKMPNPRHRSMKHKQESNKVVKVDKESSLDKDKKVDKDDDAIKYVQILFYYVQDSALFKVQVPGQDQQNESMVVKILQFSPEVLTTLYTHVSDLCFSPGTTAVTKILFSSLFGACVMVFIFLLYLGQWCISYILGKSWKMFKARLVQLFLLVVLFSYQRMVIGTFTLVQCVLVGNSTRLYMQGDVECYTWWQYATEVYIYLSIVPAFLVLSHAPFYVEERKMSVRMFILGCLFPVPVMLIYHVNRLVKRKVRTPLFLKLETDIETSSLSEHTVVSEQNQIQQSAKSDLS